MPMSYRIDPVQRLVVITIRSPYTIVDLRQLIATLVADPLYIAGFSGIVDRRAVDEVPTTAMVQQAVLFLGTYAAQLGTCRWALVVNQMASYGMGRMASIMLEQSGVTVSVFATMEDACTWLGVAAPPLDDQSALL